MCLLTPEEEALLEWPRFVYWLRKGLNQSQKEVLNPFKASEKQVADFLRFLHDGAGSLKEIAAVSHIKRRG